MYSRGHIGCNTFFRWVLGTHKYYETGNHCV